MEYSCTQYYETIKESKIGLDKLTSQMVVLSYFSFCLMQLQETENKGTPLPRAPGLFPTIMAKPVEPLAEDLSDFCPLRIFSIWNIWRWSCYLPQCKKNMWLYRPPKLDLRGSESEALSSHLAGAVVSMAHVPAGALCCPAGLESPTPVSPWTWVTVHPSSVT